MTSIDRRRPLLINEGEMRTDAALREAAKDLGFGVHTKVRVADALAIDRSGLSSEAYSYALRSHFDWVVTDEATTQPEFAVEFDGESHGTDDARRRDALKDEICRHLGLPLLRIDRSAFRPTTRRTVIGYLVEAWATYRGFCEAQERGDIPPDEIFMPWATIDVDEDGHWAFRDISAPARRLVERLWASGLLTEPGPTSATRGSEEGDPDHAEAHAWVETTSGMFVVGHARFRTYSFPAVVDSELAEDLALLDLAGRLARLTEGDDSVLVSRADAHLPSLDRGWSWSSVHIDSGRGA
jgi:hypothetical protein